MNVNDLMAGLKVLQDQGHGECEVHFFDPNGDIFDVEEPHYDPEDGDVYMESTEIDDEEDEELDDDEEDLGVTDEEIAEDQAKFDERAMATPVSDERL